MKTDAIEQNAERASNLLSAMANQKRLMILCQLYGKECSVGELTELLDARQSTISQHLALLRRDGLVRSRREGQTLFYSLATGEAGAVIETLHNLYCEAHTDETN